MRKARVIHARNNASLQMKSAGFKMDEMKSAGMAPKDMREAGFDAREARGAMSLSEMLQAGYDATSLRKAGVSASELYEAGVTDAASFVASGFALGDVKGFFPASKLKDAGYPLKDMVLSFPAVDLKGLFNAGDIAKQKGGLKYMREGGAYSIAELRQDAGVEASELKRVGVPASELVKEGYEPADIKVWCGMVGSWVTMGVVRNEWQELNPPSTLTLTLPLT